MARLHLALWSYKKINSRSKAQNIPSIKVQKNASQIQEVSKGIREIQNAKQTGPEQKPSWLIIVKASKMQSKGKGMESYKRKFQPYIKVGSEV